MTLKEQLNQYIELRQKCNDIRKSLYQAESALKKIGKFIQDAEIPEEFVFKYKDGKLYHFRIGLDTYVGVAALKPIEPIESQFDEVGNIKINSTES